MQDEHHDMGFASVVQDEVLQNVAADSLCVRIGGRLSLHRASNSSSRAQESFP